MFDALFEDLVQHWKHILVSQILSESSSPEYAHHRLQCLSLTCKGWNLFRETDVWKMLIDAYYPFLTPTRWFLSWKNLLLQFSKAQKQVALYERSVLITSPWVMTCDTQPHVHLLMLVRCGADVVMSGYFDMANCDRPYWFLQATLHHHRSIRHMSELIASEVDLFAFSSQGKMTRIGSQRRDPFDTFLDKRIKFLVKRFPRYGWQSFPIVYVDVDLTSNRSSGIVRFETMTSGQPTSLLLMHDHLADCLV